MSLKSKYQVIKKPIFNFEAEIWLYDGPAAWHFVTLPKDLAQVINELFADQKRGFGSLPLEVRIGIVTWRTSMFTSDGSFILPIKKAVLKQADLAVGDKVQIEIVINV